jgi:hypothetical protein
MDDIALNLISLAFFILVGGGIFLLVRRSQAENDHKIAQMAAENGWTLESIREPLVWGLRLKSARWILEALSRSSGSDAAPGSSNVEMSSTWQADAPGSTLLIGPRTSQSNLGYHPKSSTGYHLESFMGTMGGMLTRQVLRLALGEDADGLNEVQAGSVALRQKYMLWAQQPAELEGLLTPAVESALLAWKGAPVFVERTSSGLNIELRGVRLQNAAELHALIQLGELIHEALNLKGVSS